jgi:L-galactose dehydrogenase
MGMAGTRAIEYRKLGKTDLRVSLLGYGTSPFGDIYAKTDPAELERTVHAAIDEGINFFDSSPYYGLTVAEERLGKALAGRRDRIILATKCGRYGLDSFDFSPQRVISSLDESLRRLRTDYLDLFQVHDVEFGNIQQIIDETVPALRKLKEQGKVRYIGVTGYPLPALIRIAQNVPVDTILSYCRYNLLITDMDRDLTPFARASGIGLINASAFHMSILTERGAPDWHPAPPEVRDAGHKAFEFCRAHGVDLSQVALRFCFDHPYVSSTLVGMSNREELRSNLEVLSSQTNSELVGQLRALMAPVLNYVWPSGRPENHG